ncbi:MAG: hypothetical protein ACFNW0_01115, partial [Fretibacterium sp.]
FTLFESFTFEPTIFEPTSFTLGRPEREPFMFDGCNTNEANTSFRESQYSTDGPTPQAEIIL